MVLIDWVVHLFGTEMIRLGTEELIEPEILVLGPVGEYLIEYSVGSALYILINQNNFNSNNLQCFVPS